MNGRCRPGSRKHTAKKENSRCLREFKFTVKIYASHARIIVQVEGFDSQP